MNWGKPGLVGKYEFRSFKGYMWLKVFYHNITDLVGFNNIEDAFSINEENKFSILIEINESLKQRNNKYEFIIEYPELKTYNRWQQTNNPINESEEEGKRFVEGFREIHTSAPHKLWGGLARTSNCDPCNSLLNGTPNITGNANWYFGIGQKNGVKWHNKYNYESIPSNSQPTNIVYLWIKMPQSRVTICRVAKHRLMLETLAIIILLK